MSQKTLNITRDNLENAPSFINVSATSGMELRQQKRDNIVYCCVIVLLIVQNIACYPPLHKNVDLKQIRICSRKGRLHTRLRDQLPQKKTHTFSPLFANSLRNATF